MWFRAAVFAAALGFSQAGWVSANEAKADAKAVTKVEVKGEAEVKVELSKEEVKAVKSLNESGVTALVRVSGIGRITAKAIIAYREKNGSFATLADLYKIKGEDGKAVFGGTVEKPSKRFEKACAALKEPEKEPETKTEKI